MHQHTTIILYTHLEYRQTPFVGQCYQNLSVKAIPGFEENGIDDELLGLMADSLTLFGLSEANLGASEENSLDPRNIPLQAASPAQMPTTLPLECTVCGQSVQDDNIIGVEDVRALHLQCCRDSPPPTYSSESLYHRRLKSVTGAGGLLCRDDVPFSADGRSSPHDPGNTLPMELWEMVIDLLIDEPAALISCAFVCKSWYSRCRTYLSQGVLQLNTHYDVLRLSRYIRAHRAFANRVLVTVRGGTDGSLSHLPTFTALLAGRMPCLESLQVEQGVWRTGMTDIDFFTRMASFASISRLTLNAITLPSTSIFAQLVCSLEQLEELYLIDVRICKKQTRAQLHLPLTCRSKLCHLTVTGPQVHDLVEFFTAANLAKRLVDLTLHVGFVSYRRIVWLDAGAYHGLLAACQSLRNLHLQYRDGEDTQVKDDAVDNILRASSTKSSARVG